MPTYNVIMCQALSVPDLKKAELATGLGIEAEERLQSCSGVFFVNTKTWKAAIYHYPSGDIRSRPKAQKLLAQLVKDVAPTDACIVYGVVSFNMNQKKGEEVLPSDPYANELRSHVLGLLPEGARLQRRPAMHGRARMYWKAQGGLTFDENTNLETFQHLGQYKKDLKTDIGNIYLAVDKK